MKKLTLSTARDIMYSIAEDGEPTRVLENIPGMSKTTFYRRTWENHHLLFALQRAKEVWALRVLHRDLPEEDLEVLINLGKELMEIHLEHYGWMEIDRPLTIRKKTKLTSEWAKHNDVPVYALEYRIERLGWLPERAVTFEYLGDMLIMAFGVEKTAEEWFRITQVWVDTIVERIRRFGFTPEEAVCIPLGSSRKSGIFDNDINSFAFDEIILSVAQLASIKNVSVATIYRYKHEGMTTRQILDEPSRKKKRYPYKNGTATIYEISEDCGKGVRTLYRHMSEGKTPDEAAKC